MRSAEWKPGYGGQIGWEQVIGVANWRALSFLMAFLNLLDSYVVACRVPLPPEKRRNCWIVIVVRPWNLNYCLEW